ncbi:MAG: hypothetical protein AAF311_03345 [Pseudomonadota bacterium]
MAHGQPARSPLLRAAIVCAILYAALQYVPARAHPDRLLAGLDAHLLHSKRPVVEHILLPAWRLTQLRRGYLSEGVELKVHHALQPGQSMELVVRRCARRWLVEVLTCHPVGESRVRIDGRSDHKRLVLAGPGYYTFRNADAAADLPKPIWRRVIKKPASEEAGFLEVDLANNQRE